MLGVYDLEIYSFDFYPLEDYKDKPKDERVSLTIIKILRDFFINDNRILLYVCESVDGRGEERQVLFRHWYRNISDIVERHGLSVNIENKGTAYGSILTHRNFLHMDVLQEHLTDKVKSLIEEKYSAEN